MKIKTYTPEEKEKWDEKIHDAYLSEVERYKTEGEKFYWYKNFPEELFAEYFVPNNTQFVPDDERGDELHLISTAQLIEKAGSRDSNKLLSTAIWELYMRGYVTIEFYRLFKGQRVRIIAGKKYSKKYFFNRFPPCLIVFSTNSSARIFVNFTPEGKSWFKSIKKKYPELFEKVLPLYGECSYKRPATFPDGYDKSGTFKFTLGEGFSVVDGIVEESK